LYVFREPTNAARDYLSSCTGSVGRLRTEFVLSACFGWEYAALDFLGVFYRLCYQDANFPFPYMAAGYLYGGADCRYHATGCDYAKNGGIRTYPLVDPDCTGGGGSLWPAGFGALYHWRGVCVYHCL